MPRTEYRARVRNPTTIEADLCRLWSENLALTTPVEQKFRWLYREAPDAADAVLVLEAVVDGRASIVGTNGMAQRRFRAAGRDVRAAIACDLAVDRAHRSLLPALCLVRATRDDGLARFDLVYGFPNAKAEGVLKRAGFRELGRARRWVRVLRHARYVQGAGSRPDAPALARMAAVVPWLGKAGATIFDRLRATVSAGAARVGTTLRLRSYPGPDERWDRLWLAARDEYDVVGARTAAFLRWRFPPAPHRRFVALEGRGDAGLRGYAVLELDEPTGAVHVRDLFGHRDELGTLVDAVTGHAYRLGGSSLSIRFLGAPAVERLLLQRGFVVREGDRSVVVDLGAALAGDAAIAGDASRWHLFDVDEDA
jgi:hypothetical protein